MTQRSIKMMCVFLTFFVVQLRFGQKYVSNISVVYAVSSNGHELITLGNEGREQYCLDGSACANDAHEIPLTVVGTADGLIHGFDAANNIQWSTETGGPTASFYSSGNLDFAVIPATDGSLLINTADGMRKTSVKARMLVEKAPFSSPEGLIFTSQKKSRIIGVDLANGKVLHDLPSEERFRFPTRKESNRRARKRDPLWVGRTDYVFRAFDHITGNEEFNFTYSEIHPMNLGTKTSLKNSNVGKELAPLDGSEELHIASPPPVISTPEGYIYFFHDDGTALQSSHILSAPAITAFNIHRNDDIDSESVRPYDSYNIRPVRVALRMGSQYLRQRPVGDGDSSDSGHDRLLTTGQADVSEEGSGAGSGDTQIVLVRSLSDGSVYGVEVEADGQQQSSVAVSPPPSPTVGPQTNGRQQQPAAEYSSSDSSARNEDALRLEAKSSLIDHPLHRQNTHKHTAALRLHPALVSKSPVTSPTIMSPTQLASKNQLAFSAPQSSDDKDYAANQVDENQIVSVGRMSIEAVFPRSHLKAAEDSHNARFPVVKVGDRDTMFWESSPSPTFLDFLLNYVDESAAGAVGEQRRQPVERIITPQILSLRQRFFLESVYWLHFVETFFLRVLLLVFFVVVMLFTAIQQGLPLPTIVRSAVEVALAQIERLFLPNKISLGLIDNKLSIFSSSIEDRNAVYEDHADDVQIVNHESGSAMSKVGSLLISSEVLGYGSHGTMVFKGSLNGRPVAVKRMLSRFDRAAEREVSLLIRSDGHPNVVRYFLRETRSEFVYLALQLCRMSLREFVTRLQRQLNSERKKDGGEAVGGGVLFFSDRVRKSLCQIADGLAHLHTQRIVHRDIKPHNILCAVPDDSSSKETSQASLTNSDGESMVLSLDQLGDYVLKISDMGLSKQLDREDGSFASMSMTLPSQAGEKGSNRSSTDAGSQRQNHIDYSPVGTIGWQAPELLATRSTSLLSSSVSLPNDEYIGYDDEICIPNGGENDEPTTESGHYECHSEGSPRSQAGGGEGGPTRIKKTQKCDIFSCGCVFYYVLIPGSHPFGVWYEREANIMTGKMDISALAQSPDAYDLISRMLCREPEGRPTSAEVCHHPFFWPSQRRLEFLVDLSDRLENEAVDSPMVLAIEANAPSIVGRSWDRRLSPALLVDMNRYRKYDTASVRDLLRVIRNKRHHFHELSDSVKADVGPLPTGFVLYFEIRFPKLLMRGVEIACRYLSSDKDFVDFCGAIKSLFAPVSRVVDSDDSESAQQPLRRGGNPAYGASQPEPGLQLQLAVPLETMPDGGSDAQEVPLSRQQQLSKQYAAEQNNFDSAKVSDDVVIWQGSSLALNINCRGWWREESSWLLPASFTGPTGSNKLAPPKAGRAAHLTRSSSDMKYRSRLCTHWDSTGGMGCPMRKKGKCDFAHGPLELRVKENRRGRWGQHNIPASSTTSASTSSADSMRVSGGEDVLGAARSIERVRVAEGSVSEFERSTQRPNKNSYATTSSSSTYHGIQKHGQAIVPMTTHDYCPPSHLGGGYA